MAAKVFHLFLCIFLFSAALPLPSHASRSNPKGEKPSYFEFIKHLEGCQKGQTVKGLQQLKTYLQKFGYLNYSHNQTHANDDDFDDLLEAAVKTYQLNYHLKATGTLDGETVSKMTVPRCGNADIINGTNWMRGSKKMTNHTHNNLNTVSDYVFLPGNPKWSSDKYHLTYGFALRTNSKAISAVARAFNKWASQTQFKFSRSQDFASADLQIGFYSLDHGDGFPFTGANGALAHAFAPTDGRFHCNSDHMFSVGGGANSFDLQTVALHEIGHLLGLQHSDVQEAILFPTIPPETIKDLNADDVQGIKALYGF